jgi:hypothetical protein|tara:strand:- start:773 stop:1027 length:255 start_codon:yes stop_codon:yes gene_type:complete
VLRESHPPLVGKKGWHIFLNKGKTKMKYVIILASLLACGEKEEDSAEPVEEVVEETEETEETESEESEESEETEETTEETEEAE